MTDARICGEVAARALATNQTIARANVPSRPVCRGAFRHLGQGAESSSSRAGAVTRSGRSSSPRPNSAAGGERAATRRRPILIEQFRRLKLEPLFQGEYIQPIPGQEPGTVIGRNVGAILRGSDPSLRDQWVIVSAHFDHLGVRAASFIRVPMTMRRGSP